MGKVNEKESYSLQEIEKELKVEQHRLIHLCEKGVIIPDIEDSAGRGSMRRFSKRNLFEFALALELRRFLLPINYIAPIIRVLESFETHVAKEIQIFSLPESLQEKSTVRLRLIIAEGTRLFFALKTGKYETFLGNIDLESFSNSKKNSFSGIKKTNDDPRPSFISYIEIDLNKLAVNLE